MCSTDANLPWFSLGPRRVSFHTYTRYNVAAKDATKFSVIKARPPTKLSNGWGTSLLELSH